MPVKPVQAAALGLAAGVVMGGAAGLDSPFEEHLAVIEDRDRHSVARAFRFGTRWNAHLAELQNRSSRSHESVLSE